MEPRSRLAFLLLVLVQALHSCEEYVYRLYDVLAPARYVSELIGIDRAAGFAVANTTLFLFGLWCWFALVRKDRPSARPVAWAWALIEVANGFAHIALAIAAGGYFPGLATAPLLIAAGTWLILGLSRRQPA
jgi:hypothetical protein